MHSYVVIVHVARGCVPEAGSSTQLIQAESYADAIERAHVGNDCDKIEVLLADAVGVEPKACTCCSTAA